MPALPLARLRPAQPWLSLLARLLLAGVLAGAALSKITDPAATVRAVRAYRILPDGLAVPFGHALPWVELAVSLLLLLGLAVRVSAAIAAVMLATFVGGVASAAARGLRIDCGCFGGGGTTAQTHYTGELVRDVLLLAVAVALAVWPYSRLSLDPRPPAAPELAGDGRDTQRRHRAAVNRWSVQQALVRRRTLLHSAVAGVAVVAMAGVGVAAGNAATPTTIVTPAAATAQGGIVVGNASAPQHLVAYEDPQCPVCADFEKTGGTVVAKAVAQGKVSVEYRMMSFLGPESVRADAALGAAAQEGKFEQLRAAMFAHQPTEHTGGYTVDELISLGASVGLTDQAYVTAVRQQTYAGWAKQVENTAEKAGIVGTPTVLLDGKPLDLSGVLLQPAALAKALGVS